MNISYLHFSLNPAVFGCLTNGIAPLPITLKSCSNPQKIRQVFYSTLEKTFLVEGCGFFVSDVISEVDFGPFWLMLPGLGSNRQVEVFHGSFHWKLGSSPSLFSIWSTFLRFWFKNYYLK